MSSYITREHAARIAAQLSAKVTEEGDRLVFKIGNAVLGSTLIQRIDGETFVSRHAVYQITGVKS